MAGHHPVWQDLILHVFYPVLLGHQAIKFVHVIFIVVHTVPVIPGQPAYEFLSGRISEELVENLVRRVHDAVVCELVFFEGGHFR